MKPEARAAALFLTPAMVVLIIFFFIPVIAGFALSVTDFDLYSIGDIHNLRFVALHNYAAVLRNRMFDAVGLPPVDWLGDPRWAMPAIILLAVWKNFGYNMIIFLAGLQNIPEELYEAARIDGAGGWRQFRHITLPMLGPTFLFVGIVTAIGYLQLFPAPHVMTRRGPFKENCGGANLPPAPPPPRAHPEPARPAFRAPEFRTCLPEQRDDRRHYAPGLPPHHLDGGLPLRPPAFRRPRPALRPPPG